MEQKVDIRYALYEQDEYIGSDGCSGIAFFNQGNVNADLYIDDVPYIMQPGEKVRYSYDPGVVIATTWRVQFRIPEGMAQVNKRLLVTREFKVK